MQLHEKAYLANLMWRRASYDTYLVFWVQEIRCYDLVRIGDVSLDFVTSRLHVITNYLNSSFSILILLFLDCSLFFLYCVTGK